MIIIAESILMGAFATLFMDLTARLLVKSKLVRPTVGPEIPGRWALYMLRGKFTHEDINRTPALEGEKLAALISHYLIGMVLAGVYILLELAEPAIGHQLWVPVAFGLATVLLPWLWLYPSIGLGFLAAKAPNQADFIILSLVNHTNFGIGMLLWVLAFR